MAPAIDSLVQETPLVVPVADELLDDDDVGVGVGVVVPDEQAAAAAHPKAAADATISDLLNLEADNIQTPSDGWAYSPGWLPRHR